MNIYLFNLTRGFSFLGCMNTLRGDCYHMYCAVHPSTHYNGAGVNLNFSKKNNYKTKPIEFF